jgi:hypothetical protein
MPIKVICCDIFAKTKVPPKEAPTSLERTTFIGRGGRHANVAISTPRVST